LVAPAKGEIHSTRSQRCQLVSSASEKLHLLHADPAESENRGDGEVQLFVGLLAAFSGNYGISGLPQKPDLQLHSICIRRGLVQVRDSSAKTILQRSDILACVSDFIAPWQANRFESLPLCFDSAGADPLEMSASILCQCQLGRFG